MTWTYMYIHVCTDTCTYMYMDCIYVYCIYNAQ